MATGLYDDELPLIKEDELNHSEEWEYVPPPVSNGEHSSGPSDYSTLLDDEDEEENAEMGVKGVADEDYEPQTDECIELQKGDIVIIHGQTIDQVYYKVLNLRSNQSGEVPCKSITLECNDDFEPVPAKSNLTRGNVIRRKRSNNSDKSRRTGSDFTNSFPVGFASNNHPLEQTDSPLTQSEYTHNQLVVKDPETSPVHRRELLVKSESISSSLPIEYRRIEKLQVLSVSGSDKMGRPVIVFSACRLPPSYQINHERLFEYVKYTLDQYVENDYTLVYFHYGFNSVNKPSYSWLYQFYKELDRKYKKNLKRFYIVHPTTFVKFMMGLFRPVISYKFGKKLVYINRLAELDSVLFTDQMDIPSEVKQHDRTLRAQPRSFLQTETRSSFYVPIDEPVLGFGNRLDVNNVQFGVNIKILHERTGEDIPLVVRSCVEYISTECLNVLGIFRRTPAQNTVQEVKKKFNRGEEVNFQAYADPHLAATTLKMFLRELPEPLLCFETNSKLSQLRHLSDDERVRKCREIVESLPSLNYKLLNYLLSFVCKIVENEEVNRMSSTNLSIVFGPNLLWSMNEVASLNSMSEINRFTLLLIDNYKEIFN